MVRIFLLLLLSFVLQSCVPATEVPIPSAVVGASRSNPKEIVLLLPGRGDAFGAFRREGFMEDVQELWPEHDGVEFITVDAHLGYYYERVLQSRIEEDIFSKYPGAKVSVVGVSLGGLGALLLLQHFPGRIQEVFSISPYLGEEELILRLAGTNPPLLEELAAEERMLKLLWENLRKGQWSEQVRVTVTCGKEDYHKAQVELLERLAPAVRVTWYEGGHKWKAWRPMWRSWLRFRASESVHPRAETE